MDLLAGSGNDEFYTPPNSRKHFGNVKPSEYVALTMLATDYK